MKANVGKTKINVAVSGCISCGTYWSSAWFVAKQVKVVIGRQRGVLDIHICADCKRGGK